MNAKGLHPGASDGGPHRRPTLSRHCERQRSSHLAMMALYTD